MVIVNKSDITLKTFKAHKTMRYKDFKYIVDAYDMLLDSLVSEMKLKMQTTTSYSCDHLSQVPGLGTLYPLPGHVYIAHAQLLPLVGGGRAWQQQQQRVTCIHILGAFAARYTQLVVVAGLQTQNERHFQMLISLSMLSSTKTSKGKLYFCCLALNQFVLLLLP